MRKLFSWWFKNRPEILVIVWNTLACIWAIMAPVFAFTFYRLKQPFLLICISMLIVGLFCHLMVKFWYFYIGNEDKRKRLEEKYEELLERRFGRPRREDEKPKQDRKI